VFIASFPAGPWQTNCYVVAGAIGGECVVVDPGMDSADGVTDVITQYRLHPVAALLTHGHLDHMFSVTPLCRQHEAVCWVHPDDRDLLVDPLQAMGEETRVLLSRLTGSNAQFAEPDDVRELSDGMTISVAGVNFQAIHAPGHTAGSVMFRSPYEHEASGGPTEVDSVLFSGDVLFAGSIGRTDLPGGSHADMLRSLRTKVLPLPDSVAVLPGHGPQTTMARERAGNPYLQDRHLAASA